MIHVLGIDAGGTKTVCQLADEKGEVLAAFAAHKGEVTEGYAA